MCFASQSQTVLRGLIKDEKGEALIDASVKIKGTKEVKNTDFEGNFELKTVQPLPLTLVISYLGYKETEIIVKNSRDRINVVMVEDATVITEVSVTAKGPEEKVKESPRTRESMDALAIKQSTGNFYVESGTKKGVDVTTASMGFSVINTRGFNSTSPVRSLQIIDGVDNQAPGLNFSLGNFLGSSELDVKKFEIIVGASSALYGPNAFNGVISIETKSPFFSKGLSASVKGGERNLFEAAIRYADVVKNKAGQDVLGIKLNLFHLRAHDWEATNYSAVTDSRTNEKNPGRFDAVNIYGDEFNVSGDATNGSPTEKIGLGIFHRPGYREIDVVDYNLRNYKANAALYLRTNPKKGVESPELVYAFNFGNGTTVYQGDNRFSLKNILFLQHKIEYRKSDKFFIRAYTTIDDAGDTYDPYATALRLQDYAKPSGQWYSDYTGYWRVNIDPKAYKLGYPQVKISFDPVTGEIKSNFDQAAADAWKIKFRDSIVAWHALAATATNKKNLLGQPTNDFLVPGTPEYAAEFKRITSQAANQKDVVGTKFVDHSALYHVHGEYKFQPIFTDEIIVGANYRKYTPVSNGTIFYDTSGRKLSNYEFGFYGGIKKKYQNGRWTVEGTMRLDKNQNFQWLPSPAASLVWKPKEKGDTYWRLSFSSAIRNPTLSDQYLNLNVGRAILSGNLEGKRGLMTVPSFIDYLNTGQLFRVVKFDVAGVRPEHVQTIETGYRTSIKNKVFIDANYYYSSYRNFIGYNVAIDADTTDIGTLKNIQAYRFATNSLQRVTTQGFSIGVDYDLNKTFTLNGNYSWNTLVKADENDPIIPAFNTPKNKFNIGILGKKIKIGKKATDNVLGFKVNYKWVEGFVFEGSPQFTGLINSFDLLDVQANYVFAKQNTTVKIGATNILNNLHYEVYGGPLIGRLAYISLTYNFEKK